MLFNSFEFIFAFYPLVFLGYWALWRRGQRPLALSFMLLASLFFYGWWDPRYLLLIISSLGANYYIGLKLRPADAGTHRHLWLWGGVVGNLAVLGFFKYAAFTAENINLIFSADLPIWKMVLPLGISFFSFQIIAYLVDCYRGEANETDFRSFALFVTFFPQLIAGPIVHHSELIPQFRDPRGSAFTWEKAAEGLCVFAVGLFKKTVIADALGRLVNPGYAAAAPPHLLAAWALSLAYTFQLYFDFSGYTDMAKGAALGLGIRLPENFNSPYQALSIQDFWRRWHMTLSRFLRDYIYIPLGGNRHGPLRTYGNVFVTFFLGGIWHGAGWTFVIWGALHGVAVALHRSWQGHGLRLPTPLAWLLTFNFVNVTWVFFRAPSVARANEVLAGMVGANGVVLPQFLRDWSQSLPGVEFAPTAHLLNDMGANILDLALLVALLVAVMVLKNSGVRPLARSARHAAFWGLAFAAGVAGLFQAGEFLYFNF